MAPLPRLTPPLPRFTTPPPTVKFEVRVPPEVFAGDITRVVIVATPVSNLKSAVAGPMRVVLAPRVRVAMLRSA